MSVVRLKKKDDKSRCIFSPVYVLESYSLVKFARRWYQSPGNWHRRPSNIGTNPRRRSRHWSYGDVTISIMRDVPLRKRELYFEHLNHWRMLLTWYLLSVRVSAPDKNLKYTTSRGLSQWLSQKQYTFPFFMAYLPSGIGLSTLTMAVWTMAIGLSISRPGPSVPRIDMQPSFNRSSPA